MKDQLEPTVFVIFGGAGDLTWRKLVPALFDLSQDRRMPAQFSIIAVDRIKLGDAVKVTTLASPDKYYTGKIDKITLRRQHQFLSLH